MSQAFSEERPLHVRNVFGATHTLGLEESATKLLKHSPKVEHSMLFHSPHILTRSCG